MHDDSLSPNPQGELMLRIVPMMADASANGDISGGWLVTQMDTAAGLMATRIARGRVTTMAIGEMSFVRPVRVGSIVCCYALLKQTGRSSLRVSIEVWCRMPEESQRRKVTEAEFTYVAIDEQRRIRPLPNGTQMA
ncbi:MAG: acyl-CoA thioesterase [Natronospirillum sp.]|uniref:acyl-CoA thioesterase n=1 Tax=Natronospirillum sp. TaxID=2812955 RepID=UPI0025E5ACC9|nr:hotdog domain-containing protein [Natronospirillum sp.]MCH8551716.1 acyl-CoA thioesterase [Natronospirillum sp.]